MSEKPGWEKFSVFSLFWGCPPHGKQETTLMENNAGYRQNDFKIRKRRKRPDVIRSTLHPKFTWLAVIWTETVSGKEEERWWPTEHNPLLLKKRKKKELCFVAIWIINRYPEVGLKFWPTDPIIAWGETIKNSEWNRFMAIDCRSWMPWRDEDA